MSALDSEPAGAADWERRLGDIMRMMRETSQHSDPQAMVAAYGRHVAVDEPGRRLRGDQPPRPGRAQVSHHAVQRLDGKRSTPGSKETGCPILEGGLLGELIYDGEPRIIDDVDLADDDPAAEYLGGHRSLMAVPHLERGEALNMVVSIRSAPAAFDSEQFPDMVWTSNLFGRATHNLVLAEQVRAAYDVVDRELQVVADIQRSLLPTQLPDDPGTRSWRRTTRRRSGPAATTTTSFRSPTAAGAS